MKRRILSASILTFVVSLSLLGSGRATSFSITSGTDTTARTLSAGGETGSVSSGATLSISGSTIGITLSAPSGTTTITNAGSILQTGTGRTINNNAGTHSISITNSSGALIRSADADTLRGSVSGSNWTINNTGTISSLNPSLGGNQAIDLDAVTTGAVSITNNAGGQILAYAADAIRPGANAIIINAGVISATLNAADAAPGSDGIDAQARSGVSVTNTGMITGRHGITGGAATNTVTFTTSVTNNVGGTIQGLSGAGINLDGFNALQTATIINHGSIIGNGTVADSDGDGVDVDGLVNITNTGIIRSLNANSSTLPARSEGITVGGGTIMNSGTIEGLVAAGNTNATGIGISLLGNDTATPGVREAIYGNAVVTNQSGGLIRGQTDSGIVVGGPASGFTVTINNNAGATIQGGGAANAAILTGADNDTITNGGTINGSSSGKAIDLGAGNNTLNITGGTASISGSINGGAGGTNTMNVTLGAGNTFTYSGAITNIANTNVQSGRFNLSGSTASTNIGITGGTFNYTGSAALGSNLTVNGGELKSNGGNLTGTFTLTSGTVSGTNFAGVALNIGTGVTLSPGNSPGTLSSGSETWAGGGTYLWEINRLLADGGAQGNDPGWDFADIAGILNITANAGNKFHINVDSLGLLASWNNSQAYAFNLATASGGIVGFDASDFLIDTSAFDDLHNLGGGSFSIAQNGNNIELDFTPVPEPMTVSFGVALMGVAFMRRRRQLGARLQQA